MSAHELHHSSAIELAAMIARRELSSRELLDHLVRRVETYNPQVNAVVTLDVEHATEAARAADAATAAGSTAGPLHGVPITMKDALAVAGLRSTGGAVEHRDHVPERDADVVAAVRRAGAVVFGKTNVPRWSGDLQTYNEVFGTTNNPWDTTRVPGGSSGGAATSVALGFTGFELGTDIGGSIRLPSAYCGVVGHKPSFGLVPCGGYIDRVDYGSTEPDINVHGPIARSVDDLEMLLDLIAGPRPDRRVAVRHELPRPRHDRIDEFRVALWSDAAACPASADTVAAVEAAGDVLASIGASVDRAARPELDAHAAVRLGTRLVVSALAPSLGDAEFEFFRMLAESSDVTADVASAVGAYTMSHRSWLAADVERTRIRAVWERFFGDVDVLVCPVVISPPFHHDQEGSIADRTLLVDGVERPHGDLLWWNVLIGMAYLPSTVVPVGTTADGLPLAVQVVGPYLEDRSALAVARSLRSELGPMRFPSAPITPQSGG
jgi:amidase